MTVQIHLKQIKKRGEYITACPWVVAPVPENLRQLITMLVTHGVRSYHERLSQKDSTVPLSREDMEAMEAIGKIGFGIPYGTREVDLAEAVDAAIQGCEDGLFRVFIGDREPEHLDAPLNLRENDTVTIIRLVMLTGGYF